MTAAVLSRSGEEAAEAVSTPIELARAYASLATTMSEMLGKRLAKLESELDEVKGIALASHGIAADVRSRLEDIAASVKAPVRRASPMGPPQKFEIEYVPTETGTHALVEQKEIDRWKQKWDDKEAEERGAKAALLQLQAEEELNRKRAKAKREFWLFIAALLGLAGGTITYVIEHFSWHH